MSADSRIAFLAPFPKLSCTGYQLWHGVKVQKRPKNVKPGPFTKITIFSIFLARNDKTLQAKKKYWKKNFGPYPTLAKGPNGEFGIKKKKFFF